MSRDPILTLTTDFGTEGPYVASIKGVVLGLVRGTQFVDVSHSVSPQNVFEGAFVLAEVVESFPSGTVHLAVVDPGVGTDRRLIAVSVAEQWFVLPDNGLITGVLRGRSASGVWEIVNPAIRRAKVSATFHGRDILAPAAAHLLQGGDPSVLGPTRATVVRLRNFEPTVTADAVVGEVIFRDAFGNLITNLSAECLSGSPAEEWTVEISDRKIRALSRTYSDHAPGSLVALFGSNGWLEVALVNGDAARLLSAGPGSTVLARRPPRTRTTGGPRS